MASPANFEKLYGEFVDDLVLTFPEYKSALSVQYSETTKSDFCKIWKPHTVDVASKNNAIFSSTGFEILPGFTMTSVLWREISESTQNAIWKYISSLLLLAASDEVGKDGFWDISGFNAHMEAMMNMLKSDGADDEMGSIFEKLSKMAESFGLNTADLSGAKFKIPEKLFKGHIAKIAEELVKEFKPEDFGISPEMLETNDPARVFTYLQEIFTKKPEMLMVSAQKIAKKIQAKFARGEIRREEIIREAEELMKEFSENEAFSSLFGSLGEMLKSSEKESGNEGSARRREVQERLRRKAAEKAATRGASTTASTNVIVHNEAEAAAIAAELLREEAAAVATLSSKPKGKKK